MADTLNLVKESIDKKKSLSVRIQELIAKCDENHSGTKFLSPTNS